MTNGIHDTKFMKKLTGSKLKDARGTISRQKLVNILNSREDRPVIGNEKATLSIETLKKWEYGENPINIEWLPVICDVLGCDIGYLFGEYKQKRREVSDVCAVTGLSPGAVNAILYMTENGKKDVLNQTISNYHFFRFLGLIYRLSKAKQKPGFDRYFNNPTGDISEEYVYEAVATNEAAKLVSEVSDELIKEVKKNVPEK